jgi:hypothetical protein
VVSFEVVGIYIVAGGVFMYIFGMIWFWRVACG